MKKQDPLAGFTVLLAVLLILGTTEAQVPGKFDRFAGLRHDSSLTQTNGMGQQNQAPTASRPQAPPHVQYMVIELGGRRSNDISESGQIVGSKVSAPEPIHAAFWASSDSAPIDLGTIPGLNSVAFSINPRREIVGYAPNEDFS